MLKDIGEIRAVRKRLGLTQTELAERSGVSQSLIAKIENGNTTPSYEKGRKILDKLEEMIEQNSMNKKVKEVQSKDILSLEKNDKVETALQIMEENAVSQLPVIDGGLLKGGVTESSLLKNYETIDRDVPVEKIMDPPFPLIDENAGIETVKKLLMDQPCVLTSREGRIIGIVTKVDILGEI
ncbi:MAG: CBS domain-containing protein [Candidatus Saliniplasma sp.]